MSLQYVEFGDAPAARHVFKSKKSKIVLALCGASAHPDEAIIFAQRTSSLIDRPAAPACEACGVDDVIDETAAAEPAPAEPAHATDTTTNGHGHEPDPAPTAPRAGVTFAELQVDKICRSPLNHRKTFRGIEELGADIKANGLKVPIKVRPIATLAGVYTYELVYGERRWRAAVGAGVATLPSLIQELTDVEVIEQQIVENVSRVDVHPLEEADGYRQLIDEYGYDVDQLVTKTGKSRTAIYNRLKLCELPDTARAAFLDDKLSASVAELIARIPVPKLRESAARMIMKGRRENFWDLAEDFDEDLDNASSEGLDVMKETVQPLSVREAAALIQRRFMLRLDVVGFDKTDEKLVPSAGACTKCVFRTGNQPDLFTDVASADVCTNPPCFESKKKADWEQRSVAAKAEGKRVMPTAESDSLFSGDKLTYNAPYIDLRAEASWEFQPQNGKHDKTWGDVLGKTLPPITVARDDGGAAHELVDRKAAMDILKQHGRLPKAAQQQLGSKDARRDAGKKEREKKLIQRITAEAAMMVITESNLRSLDASLWVAQCAIRQASMESHEATCRRRGIEPKKVGKFGGMRAGRENALLDLARSMKSSVDLDNLVRELLAWESACSSYQVGWGKNLTDAAKVFGFDLAKLKSKAEAEAKQAKAAKKTKPSKTKPAAKAATDDGKRCGAYDGKSSVACVLDNGHEGRHSNGTRTWPDKKPAKKGARK